MSLFFEVADIRWNNSHEAIARSYCDETLPNSRRQTVKEDLFCWQQIRIYFKKAEWNDEAQNNNLFDVSLVIPDDYVIALIHGFKVFYLCTTWIKLWAATAICFCFSADILTLNRLAGGVWVRPQAGSSLCCAETVSSKELKLLPYTYRLSL